MASRYEANPSTLEEGGSPGRNSHLRRSEVYVDMEVVFSSPYSLGLELFGYGVFSVPPDAHGGQKLHAYMKVLNEVERPLIIGTIIPTGFGFAVAVGVCLLLLTEVAVPVNYIVSILAFCILLSITITVRFKLVAREVRAYAERLREHSNLKVDVIPLEHMNCWRGASHGFRVSLVKRLTLRVTIPNARRRATRDGGPMSDSDVTSPRSPVDLEPGSPGSPKMCDDSSRRRKLQAEKNAAILEAAEHFQALHMNAVAVMVREKKLTLAHLRRFTDVDWTTEFSINTTELRTIKQGLRRKLGRHSVSSEPRNSGAWSPKDRWSPRAVSSPVGVTSHRRLTSPPKKSASKRNLLERGSTFNQQRACNDIPGVVAELIAGKAAEKVAPPA